jgi:hypothetical protein
MIAQRLQQAARESLAEAMIAHTEEPLPRWSGAALTRPWRSAARGRRAAVFEGFHDRLVWGTSLTFVARGPLELGSASNSTIIPTFRVARGSGGQRTMMEKDLACLGVPQKAEATLCMYRLNGPLLYGISLWVWAGVVRCLSFRLRGTALFAASFSKRLSGKTVVTRTLPHTHSLKKSHRVRLP